MTGEFLRSMISVVTRSCGRTEKLQRNQLSLQLQTDPDFEQIIIIDTKNLGYLHANTQIFEIADKLHGNYIYVFDDDDYITDVNFISSFKYFLSSHQTFPPVIICKGLIDKKLFPKVWQKPLHRGQIGSPNFIVKNETFQLYAINWVKDRAGDWYFISSCNKHEDFCWWDQTVFKAE